MVRCRQCARGWRCYRRGTAGCREACREQTGRAAGSRAAKGSCAAATFAAAQGSDGEEARAEEG